jgi:hypothetical protein
MVAAPVRAGGGVLSHQLRPGRTRLRTGSSGRPPPAQASRHPPVPLVAWGRLRSASGG